MANNHGSETQGDVALLVDWENLKFSLDQRGRRPNVTALRAAAERFGRIVYARAYADWQDPVHSGDPPNLYMAGLEPVYVLTKRYTEASGEVRIKNSVDVKLAADCIEASHSFPNVQTYIIVSGDHGFLHVVNTLQPHGKRVVVIGVSWTTAAQLTEQADVVLYYDVDVEPVVGEVRPGAVAAAAAPRKVAPGLADVAATAIGLIENQGTKLELDAREVAEALDRAMEIIREHRREKRELSVSVLGQELQKGMQPGEFQRAGKGRARVYAQALQAHGLIRMVSYGFVDWLFLPGESTELTDSQPAPAFAAPRYDYAGYVYSDMKPEQQERAIQAIHEERNKPGTGWLTFNKIIQVLMPITGRDEFATKNLVNNMTVVGVLRFDPAERQGRDPITGTFYSYRTVGLDLEHPDVRRALKLG